MPLVIALVASVVTLGVALGMLFFFSGRRFLRLLRQYPTFSGQGKAAAELQVAYAGPGDDRLRRLREVYDLDAVAGNGGELDKIVNLMRWVNRLAKHTPNPPRPAELNALHLIHLCQTEHKKLNCWMYSIILAEVYLAMGLAARMIHLNPSAVSPRESHLLVAVYSTELGHWIMMDPDFCAYLRDQDGHWLGIPEIRRRLVAGEPLVVNDDVGGFARFLGKWSYRWYLSKNIFRYNCPQRSEPDYESQPSNRVYIELIPDGYHAEWLAEPQITPRGNKIVYINDEEQFWAHRGAPQAVQE